MHCYIVYCIIYLIMIKIEIIYSSMEIIWVSLTDINGMKCKLDC